MANHQLNVLQSLRVGSNYPPTAYQFLNGPRRGQFVVGLGSEADFVVDEQGVSRGS